MDASTAAAMQMQVRQNAEDLQDFMKGLESWEEEIKEKDQNLSRQKPILKESLPPVRSQKQAAHKKRKKKVKVKVVPSKTAEASRIKSYDYRSWDNFDVDKACEEVDYQVQSSSSSYESESASDDEGEESQRKQRAIEEKENGNELFKKRSYELAVECYTRAMDLDPSNAVFPANRAMALLKMERFAAAETDCSSALELDSSYLKAYLRRGTARCKLKEFPKAREDFEMVLKIEPGNSVALAELERLDKEIGTSGSRFIRAVKRPGHLRSKEPLKRILIEDVGYLEAPTAAPPPATETTTATLATATPLIAASATATSASTTPLTATSASTTPLTATFASTTPLTATSTSMTSLTATSATTTPLTATSATATPLTAISATATPNSKVVTVSEQPNQQSDKAAAVFNQPSNKLDQPPSNKVAALSEKGPLANGIEVMPDSGTRKGSESIPAPPIIQASTSCGNQAAGGAGEAAHELGRGSRLVDPWPPAVDTRMTVTMAAEGVVADEGPVGQDIGGSENSDAGKERSLPPVPSTSFQFQADWKRLRGKGSLLAQYFKAIPPVKYPVLLQQSLETDLFQDIITILHDNYVRSGETCLAELSGLTKVKRFSVAVMFLSKPQKQGLDALFQDLFCLLSLEEDKQRLSVLAKQFSVTIN